MALYSWTTLVENQEWDMKELYHKWQQRFTKIATFIVWSYQNLAGSFKNVPIRISSAVRQSRFRPDGNAVCICWKCLFKIDTDICIHTFWLKFIKRIAHERTIITIRPMTACLSLPKYHLFSLSFNLNLQPFTYTSDEFRQVLGTLAPLFEHALSLVSDP